MGSRSKYSPTALLVLASLMATPAVWGQYAVSPVTTLGVPELAGANPSARMILASDGAFYGTTYAGGGAIRGTVFKLSEGGAKLEVLRRFPEFHGDGAVVYGGVIEGENGLLYGTTGEGGASNQGTIFRLNRDGSGYRVIHSFTGTAGDGAQGFAGLIEGSDGLLYGTTRYGGSNNKGTVFRVDLEGANYHVLHSFTGTHDGGAEPVAQVVEGPDGKLYGTTYGATIEGSTTNRGTVFNLNRDGTGFVVLRQFTGQGGDGAHPYAELAVGGDGLLYGSTADGGDSDQGILFRLRPDGSDYQKLHQFGSVPGGGRDPFGAVLESEEGILHGMTVSGGTHGLGVVFTLERDGTGFQLLHSFAGGAADGVWPYGGVTKGGDGMLYGTTYYGGPADQGTLFRMRPDASDYEVLQHFTGAGGGAAEPNAALARGTDGAFYGTSWRGGNGYKGTIFRISPENGVATVLHHFGGGTTDGVGPYGGVIEGSDGVLYGTAVEGGGTANAGVVFKVNKDGSGFAILHSFVSASSGGYYPYGGLLEASDGLLYGTTVRGGSGNYGTIFRINRSGSGYSVFRSFSGGNDGAHPYAGVVEGSDGFLYGVTAFGGGSDRGTVFRIRHEGGDYTVLWRFTGSEDGRNPYTRLLVGDDGLLYGTTSNGGRSDFGTVFRLARNGADFLSLYQFDGSTAEGLNALGGVSEGPDGLLYGTTAAGGQLGVGTLYAIHKDGTGFQVRHHFRGEYGEGANPSGELVKGADGMFYGTTRTGGIGCGTVYRLAPQVSLTMAPGGLVELMGPTGFVYSVQASLEATSAATWQTVTNVTITSHPTTVQIPGHGTGSRRFLRTLLGLGP